MPIVNNKGKWAKNGRKITIKSLKMVQMIQNLDQGCILMVFIDPHNFFENGSKLAKIWPKNADFSHFRVGFL